MSDRGSHKLVSGDLAQPEEPRSFCWACLLLPLALLAWFFVNAMSGRTPEPPAQPPEPRVAVFQATNIAEIANPLTIILGGSNYDFEYETVDSLSQIEKQINRKGIFYADFSKNISSGDLEKAGTVILVGSVSLSIGALNGSDILHASTTIDRKKINAYFNYAQSPTGPPNFQQNAKKRKIIIVGEMTNINFPTTFGSSQTNISILELSPSKEKIWNYTEEMLRYDLQTEAAKKAKPHSNRPGHR